MQQTIAQRFTDQCRVFLRSAAGSDKSTRKNRARVFIEDVEPRLASLFLMDQTESIFRKCERADEREARAAGLREDPQLRFAGIDFVDLFARGFAERLPVKGAHKIRLDAMTITQMRQAAAILRHRALTAAEKAKVADEARAAWLDRTAEEMSPYSPQRGARLTYAQYLELRSAGTPARAAKAMAAARA